jgi:hypothetical protein
VKLVQEREARVAENSNSPTTRQADSGPSPKMVTGLAIRPKTPLGRLPPPAASATIRGSPSNPR